jgi:hypothetical protein
MPEPQRPERTLGQLTIDLDDEVTNGRRHAGRVEQLVARAITAGVEAGVVDDQLDQGAAALAVSLARAVDLGARDPYAVAAAGRELSALLARLRLDPEARDRDGAGNVAGEAARWLHDVTRPG